jgi:hypothetical protein
MNANPLNWRVSKMCTRKIITAAKNQPVLRLKELGRNKLFELIGEAVYKWSLVQRIRNEARERALAGLISIK